MKISIGSDDGKLLE